MDIKLKQSATETVDYKVIEELASLYNTEDLDIEGNLSLSTDYCFEDTYSALQGSDIQITTLYYLARLDPYFEKFLYKYFLNYNNAYKTYFHEGHWIINPNRNLINVTFYGQNNYIPNLVHNIKVMDFSNIDIQYLELRDLDLTSCERIVCPPNAVSIGLGCHDRNLASLGSLPGRTGCPLLSSLIFPSNPNSLLYVGPIGFTKLTSITIPDSVITVAGIAKNPLLTTLHLGNSVTGIYNCQYNDNLVNVNAPSSLTTVGSAAFFRCSKLPEFDLTYVQHVGESAFCGCINLLDFTTFENIIDMSSSAFSDCTKAETDIHLVNATQIGLLAFSGYNKKALTAASVIIDCPITDGNMSAACFDESGIGSVVFTNRSQLTKIPNSTFRRCHRLLSVTINSNITKIGDTVFGDSALSSFDFTNITEIGRGAFSSSNLTGDIDLSNVTMIGFNAFAGTSVNITNLNNAITPELFAGTDDYKRCVFSTPSINGDYYSQVTLTDRLVNQNAVFWQGKGDQRIGYNGDMNENEFEFVESTGTLTIKTPYIDSIAFIDNTKIKKVVSNTLLRIKHAAFLRCYNLAEFDCPNAIIDGVGENFFDLTNLVNVRFGGVTTNSGSKSRIVKLNTRVEITSSSCDFGGTSSNNVWDNYYAEIILPDTVIDLSYVNSVPPLYEFYVSSTSVKNAYLADAKWSQITNASNRFHLKSELKEILHQHIDTVNFTSGTKYPFVLTSSGKTNALDMYCFPVTEGDIVLLCSTEIGTSVYYLLQDTVFDDSNVLASLYSTLNNSMRTISRNTPIRVVIPAGVNYLGVTVNRAPASWTMEIDRYYKGSNYLTV